MSTQNGLSAEPTAIAEAHTPLSAPTLKSLFVELYFGDTLLSTATAFLLAFDRNSHCALVTNRHNVTGRHQETGACLSKHGAIPDSIKVYFHSNEGEDEDLWIPKWLPVQRRLYKSDGTPDWIEHPKFGRLGDMVAINFSWGSDTLRYPYYLKTEIDRAGIIVGPAEAISVIGFPFGLSTYGKFPIWATGFLAQELSQIEAEQPTFLIDCRARSGQSGSPVIAHRTQGARMRQGNKIVATLSPNPIWEFLGIYCGRVNPESDLGVVWHTSALEELLTAAEKSMKPSN
jgi:hypothetical protein